MKVWWADLRTWLGPILRQRTRNDWNWILPRRARWWLTCRAVVALLIYADDERGRCYRRGGYNGSDDVEVALGPVRHWSHPEFGAAYDFDYFAVPRKGFGYRIGSDGAP